MISQLDFSEIKGHYDIRENLCQQLRKEFSAGQVDTYVKLALGVSNDAGNYSASEHALGHSILNETLPKTVFLLAKKLDECDRSSHIPSLIYKMKIPYLKISVGSEIAMMLRPDEFWVGNVRTIWSHLLLKHNWNLAKANEELDLYKDNDRTSEMDYQVWRDLYLSAEKSLLELAILGTDEAKKQGVNSGNNKFLWADAIASSLYDMRK